MKLFNDDEIDLKYDKKMDNINANQIEICFEIMN